MEFVKDLDNFAICFGRTHRDWKKAKENFFYLVDHWSGAARSELGNLVKVEKIEDKNLIVGEVYGKNFQLELHPVSVNNAGLLEGIVSVNVQGTSTVHEVARFLIDKDSSIVDDDGQIIVDGNQNFGSYRIFVSIIQAVIEARMPKAPQKSQ